jgi:hypothetical protein
MDGEDLTAFKTTHPPRHHGAPLADTAGLHPCGSAMRYGWAAHEITIGGVTCLDWQPRKRGSARVTIPLPPSTLPPEP